MRITRLSAASVLVASVSTGCGSSGSSDQSTTNPEFGGGSGAAATPRPEGGAGSSGAPSTSPTASTSSGGSGANSGSTGSSSGPSGSSQQPEGGSAHIDGGPSTTSTDAGPMGTPSADASADAPADGTSSGIDGSADGGLDGGNPCGAGAMALSASDAPGVTASSSYAAVKWMVSTTTQILGFWMTLTVPALPKATSGTLFIWPGLQPLGNSKNYNPLGDGILQPVLSVGGSCAPGSPNNYTTWYESGMYVYSVNYGNMCTGGQGMEPAVGDQLDIAMTLSGTTWTQAITDRQTGKSVTFDTDLMGQGQNWATLAIEPYSITSAADVVWTSVKLTWADSNPMSCQPSQHGPTDYFATPYVSQDGKSCCVSRVILRQQGAPMTTQNGP